mgnify:CR=1 FL=1
MKNTLILDNSHLMNNFKDEICRLMVIYHDLKENV